MTGPAAPGERRTAPSATRWAILAAYALLTACTQLLWLTFAPVDTQVARAMGVDAGQVGNLAVAFPLVFIVLALPTGRWLDRSFGPALAAGAFLTGGGALLRLAAPETYAWQLGCQLVIACGQPLVNNAINKVAARAFPERERATAISIGSVALFAGILASVLTAGPLLAAGGLRLLLGAQAAFAVAAAVAVVASLRIPAMYPDSAPPPVGLRWLLRDRLLWTLAGLMFIGMGVFNAVATWLEPILDRGGQGGLAGPLVAVMTITGIAGAAVLAPAAAARDRRRRALLATVAVTTIAFAAVAATRPAPWLLAWFAVEGFFLLSALPVVFDWSEVHAGPERQGAAVGFILMAGNLGGVVLVLLTQPLLGSPALALGALALVGALGIPLAISLPARTLPAAAPSPA